MRWVCILYIVRLGYIFITRFNQSQRQFYKKCCEIKKSEKLRYQTVTLMCISYSLHYNAVNFTKPCSQDRITVLFVLIRNQFSKRITVQNYTVWLLKVNLLCFYLGPVILKSKVVFFNQTMLYLGRKYLFVFSSIFVTLNANVLSATNVKKVLSTNCVNFTANIVSVKVVVRL